MQRRIVAIRVKAFVLVFAVAFFVFCVANTARLETTALNQGYILALMLCTVAGLLFLSNRPSFALFLGGGLFFFLKFISVMKERFLESPLMPPDFVYFSGASLVETLGHYPKLERLAIVLGIVTPLILIALWLLDFKLFARLRMEWQSVIRIVGFVVCAVLVWRFLVPAGPFAAVYKDTGTWDTISGQARMTGFFTAIHNSSPTLPPMTNMTVAKQNWAATDRSTRGSGGTRPDIIEVLEESTFNPAMFAACTIPECQVPMFQPDKYTRAYGLLRTHTFGGGTWVSEFAAFSGMPQDIFGKAGMYAPYVLAPRVHDTLPQYLDKLGYMTIGVYPTGGNFINARNAYRDYGFKKYYDVHQLGLVMWHTTDAQMFAAAKKVYDENKKPGQPIFMMILTLEQHGPHNTKPLTQLPPPFNKGLLPGLPADEELNLSTYLSRVQSSNEGMTQLEHDFLDRPQPTVTAWFGDHLPSFGGLIRKMPQNLPAVVQAYHDNLTWYMVKSNFAGPQLPRYPMLDIAYLPSMVLRAAGLPESPYFDALTTLETRCGGTYTECQNKQLLDSYYAWIFYDLHVYQ